MTAMSDDRECADVESHRHTFFQEFHDTVDLRRLPQPCLRSFNLRQTGGIA